MSIMIIICLLLLVVLGHISSESSAPKLVPLLSPRVQKEHSHFGIYCSLDEGDGPFFFEWFKDGNLVRPGPEIDYRIENSPRSSLLSIDKVTRSNAGNYTCAVKNNYSSDSQTVILNVKGIVNFI